MDALQKWNLGEIPQSLKESVLDLTFNKGVIDDESFKGLIYCLKNGKWEAAINKLTYNKSIKTKKEMSGLSKRRLFDISLATKMYGKNIPQSKSAMWSKSQIMLDFDVISYRLFSIDNLDAKKVEL